MQETQSGSFTMTPEGAVFNFPHSKRMLTFVFSKEKGHVSDLPVAYPVPSPTEYANFMDNTYLNLNVLDVDNKI